MRWQDKMLNAAKDEIEEDRRKNKISLLRKALHSYEAEAAAGYPISSKTGVNRRIESLRKQIAEFMEKEGKQ